MTQLPALLLVVTSRHKGSIELFSLADAELALVLGLVLLAAAYAIPMLRGENLPAPGPASLTVPPQLRPAVAAILLHPSGVPAEAAAATVVDLAARGLMEVIELGGGAAALRPTGRTPATTLTAYEQRVLELITRAKGADGLVPTQALLAATAGDEAAAWRRAFAAEVLDEARRAGWVRRRYGREVMSLTVILLLAAAGTITKGVHGATLWRQDASAPPQAGLRGGLMLAAAAAALLTLAQLIRMRSAGAQTLTAAGAREAASAAGLAEALRADENLDRVGLGAVATWGPLLAYATAFDAARTVEAALPLGPEDPYRAWTDASGRWRLVRIRYGGGLAGSWGQTPGDLLRPALQLAIPVMVVCTVGASAWRTFGGDVTSWLRREAPLDLLLAVPAVLLADALLRAAAGFVVGVLSLVLPSRSVEGRVLRTRAWTSGRWIAVDDGANPVVRAYLGPASLSTPAKGEPVRLRVRAVTGRLRSITPIEAHQPVLAGRASW